MLCVQVKMGAGKKEFQMVEYMFRAVLARLNIGLELESVFEWLGTGVN